MKRTYVVTGSASGMGAATKALLESAGQTVIGVDRHDAEVIADLGTALGRRAMVDGVAAGTGGRLDGVIACAGLSGGANEPEPITRVNYFGALATLADLRPLLARSAAPRAVAVASLSAILGHLKTTWDELIVEACLTGDEEHAVAVARAEENSARVYASVKRALILWVRRAATSPEWVADRILLNVVAPGLIETPMSRYLFATPEREAETMRLRPQPLGRGHPDDVASLLAWIVGEANGFVTGQLVCVDGGYEALVRPTDI